LNNGSSKLGNLHLLKVKQAGPSLSEGFVHVLQWAHAELSLLPTTAVAFVINFITQRWYFKIKWGVTKSDFDPLTAVHVVLANYF
jgi:hypothetical protein